MNPLHEKTVPNRYADHPHAEQLPAESAVSYAESPPTSAATAQYELAAGTGPYYAVADQTPHYDAPQYDAPEYAPTDAAPPNTVKSAVTMDAELYVANTPATHPPENPDYAVFLSEDTPEGVPVGMEASYAVFQSLGLDQNHDGSELPPREYSA